MLILECIFQVYLIKTKTDYLRLNFAEFTHLNSIQNIHLLSYILPIWFLLRILDNFFLEYFNDCLVRDR